MPDIEILNILTIQCNTVGTEEADTDANCSTNRPVTHGTRGEQHYANTRPETGEPVRSCTNRNNISNFYAKTGSNFKFK